ncbi:MAG: tRNA dihydrouridine synthase DusB [Firmicutes bacterium]|nr:tRNA dihydrouridine synthase DusB [Bacillota bacterium]
MKNIGSFTPSTPFFLSPMAGFTDVTYRDICGRMGASLVYTEMVSAKGLYYGDRKSPELLEIGEEGTPTAYQIFGSDPDIMAWATEKLDKEKNVLIDVNMGCPVPKVVKNGEGSALLKNPELIYKIIKKMSDATDKPVSAKIRIGIIGASENAGVEAAMAIEEAGGACVAVHGRTREQYYSGSVDRGYIKRIKESVSIPVIGNGDITSYQDAMSMMDETGCDFVMVGRAALGNPWIFRELRAAWLGEETPCRPTDSELLDAIIAHYTSMEKAKGEYIAVREMRKFIPRYLRGIQGSASIRGLVNSIENGKELCKALEQNLARNS